MLWLAFLLAPPAAQDAPAHEAHSPFPAAPQQLCESTQPKAGAAQRAQHLAGYFIRTAKQRFAGKERLPLLLFPICFFQVKSRAQLTEQKKMHG